MSVSATSASQLLVPGLASPAHQAAPSKAPGEAAAAVVADGVGPARADETQQLIPKPVVASTAPTGAVSAQQQASLDGTALVKNAIAATKANAPAWIAANQVAQQNLKTHEGFLTTGQMHVPSAEESTRQLKVLTDHLSSDEMGPTLPITLQVQPGVVSPKSFPELFTPDGASARELTGWTKDGGYGLDAVSRNLVTHVMQPENAPHGVAQGILQLAGTPVPADLLPAVPAYIRNALGPQGQTFANLCPELFTAAVGSADNKQFAQDAMERSNVLLQSNPSLPYKPFPNVQTLYGATNEALKEGAAEPPMIRNASGQPVLGPIDHQAAARNFLAIANYYSNDGLKDLFPLTAHGTGELAAVAGGDKSALARVSTKGFEGDLRTRMKQWEADGAPYEASVKAKGQPMYKFLAVANCIMADADKNPQIAKDYPEVYGSAAKLVLAFDQQWGTHKANYDGSGGYQFAG